MSKTNKDPLLDDDSSTTGEAPSTPAPSKTPKSDAPAAAPQPAAPAPRVEVTAAMNNDIIAQTKAILAKEPKTNFIIPLADGEAQGAYDTVQINGYRLTIQKGVMVELPVSVAKLLAEKYRINMTAGADKRIDRAADIQSALT